MTKINVAEYWPVLAVGEQRRFDYKASAGAPTVASSVFVADPQDGSVLCIDADANGNWTSTWFITYDKLRGVIEWRDDYSLTGFMKTLFGTKQEGFVKGSEILWGAYVNIGDVLNNSCCIDYAHSHGVTPFFSGPWAWGSQHVQFIAHLDTLTTVCGDVYKDVLQYQYAQTWNGVTQGATYWAAKGIGPVQIQWFAPDASGKVITADPVAAKVAMPAMVA